MISFYFRPCHWSERRLKSSDRMRFYFSFAWNGHRVFYFECTKMCFVRLSRYHLHLAIEYVCLKMNWTIRRWSRLVEWYTLIIWMNGWLIVSNFSMHWDELFLCGYHLQLVSFLAPRCCVSKNEWRSIALLVPAKRFRNSELASLIDMFLLDFN